jgi:hypothetical protein
MTDNIFNNMEIVKYYYEKNFLPKFIKYKNEIIIDAPLFMNMFENNGKLCVISKEGIIYYLDGKTEKCKFQNIELFQNIDLLSKTMHIYNNYLFIVDGPNIIKQNWINIFEIESSSYFDETIFVFNDNKIHYYYRDHFYEMKFDDLIGLDIKQNNFATTLNKYKDIYYDVNINGIETYSKNGLILKEFELKLFNTLNNFIVPDQLSFIRGFSHCVFEDKLYLFGGYDETYCRYILNDRVKINFGKTKITTEKKYIFNYSNLFFTMDLKTYEIKCIDINLKSKSHTLMIQYKNLIYIFFGVCNDILYKEVIVYNPKNNKHTTYLINIGDKYNLRIPYKKIFIKNDIFYMMIFEKNKYKIFKIFKAVLSPS